MVYVNKSLLEVIDENVTKDYRLNLIKLVKEISPDSGLDPSYFMKDGDGIEIIETPYENFAETIENGMMATKSNLEKMNVDVSSLHMFVYTSEGGVDVICSIYAGFDNLKEIRDIEPGTIVGAIVRIGSLNGGTAWYVFGPFEPRAIKNIYKKQLSDMLGYNL